MVQTSVSFISWDTITHFQVGSKFWKNLCAKPLRCFFHTGRLPSRPLAKNDVSSGHWNINTVVCKNRKLPTFAAYDKLYIERTQKWNHHSIYQLHLITHSIFCIDFNIINIININICPHQRCFTFWVKKHSTQLIWVVSSYISPVFLFVVGQSDSYPAISLHDEPQWLKVLAKFLLCRFAVIV